jgi:hypothetical protein
MQDVNEVYEVVDFSSDETYYAQGLWLTLDDALKALANAKRPTDIASDGEHDGYYRVEIRRRKVGWDGYNKCIYCIIFHERYDEERDEYVWDRTDTFGNCIRKGY